MVDPNNMRKMRQMMQPGGIAQQLMQDKYEDQATGHTYSEAALIADVVNIMRLNTKQLGAIHGVEVSIQRMTEERAAQLLEQMARNDDMALVSVFEKIEDKQDAIIQEVLGDEEYYDFLEQKERAAMSIPNEAVGDSRPDDLTADEDSEEGEASDDDEESTDGESAA